MDNILHLPITGSTNADAYALAVQGAEHGFAVLADCQTGGKGRLGHQWISPSHTGLCASVVLRPNLPFIEFPKLTLTAGLALCKVIEECTGLDIFGLKWPNDLYCKGRKCGGILVESSSPATSDDKSFVVVGFGLNVNSQLDDFPSELRGSVSSLLLQTSKYHSIQDLFILIRDSLLHHLAIHEEQGFEAILLEWRKRDVLFGKEMQWLSTKNTVVTGVGLGPDASGQLVVRDKEGNLHEILSGDVSLKNTQRTSNVE